MHKFNTYAYEFILEKYLRNAAFAFRPIGKLIDDRWKLGQIDFCKLDSLLFEYILHFQAIRTSSRCVNNYSAHFELLLGVRFKQWNLSIACSLWSINHTQANIYTA
jgi:hypothetical protein